MLAHDCYEQPLSMLARSASSPRATSRVKVECGSVPVCRLRAAIQYDPVAVAAVTVACSAESKGLGRAFDGVRSDAMLEC